MFMIDNSLHKEYLHQVIGAKGEICRSSPNPVLQFGEVVLVGDGDKRLCWKLGVIQEQHSGRDGHCRAATCAYRVNFCDDPSRSCIG